MYRYLLKIIAQEATEKNKRRNKTKRTIGPESRTIWMISVVAEMGMDII
jgi:hypothetical protein